MSNRQARTYDINEVARRLNRCPATIRNWEYSGKLPRHLTPPRGPRKRRYWTEELLLQVEEWMKVACVPGSGIVKALAARDVMYDAPISPEAQARALAASRKLRGPVEEQHRHAA